MSERERSVDDDMWRTPVAAKSEDDTAVAEEPAEASDDAHAYEDSWYQVLRGNVAGDA